MPVRRIEVTNGATRDNQSLMDVLLGGSVVLCAAIAVVLVLYYR